VKPVKIATDIRTRAPITLDLTRSRAILITGKRGSGKTTTLHTLAAVAAETGATVVCIDPLGALHSLATRAPCLTPGGDLHLNPSDLSTDAWLALFDLNLSNPSGICLSRAIRRAPPRYTIPDLIHAVEEDDRSRDTTLDAVVNRLEAADAWGIFTDTYRDLADTFTPGIHIIDLSHLDPGPHSLRNLTVSLLVSRLFARAQAHRPDIPLWLILDEAHNFACAPALSARPLLRWAQEGRNLGLSLALATQRPAALPADIISQADILIIHRLTMLDDVKAIARLASTYARDLGAILKAVREPGQAIIVDDAAERAVVGKIIRRKQ